MEARTFDLGGRDAALQSWDSGEDLPTPVNAEEPGGEGP